MAVPVRVMVVKDHHLTKAASGRLGGVGWQTVAWSRDLDDAKLKRLDELSATTHPLDLDSGAAILGCVRLDFGFVFSKIQRVEAIPQDQRPNYYCHNVICPLEELGSLNYDLPRVLAAPGLFTERVEGPYPKLLEPRQVDVPLDGPSAMPAGLAEPKLAELVDGLLDASPRGPCHVIMPPGTDALAVLRAVWPALPLPNRAQATFKTLVDNPLDYEWLWSVVFFAEDDCAAAGRAPTGLRVCRVVRLSEQAGAAAAETSAYASECAQGLAQGDLAAVERRRAFFDTWPKPALVRHIKALHGVPSLLARIEQTPSVDEVRAARQAIESVKDPPVDLAAAVLAAATRGIAAMGRDEATLAGVMSALDALGYDDAAVGGWAGRCHSLLREPLKAADAPWVLKTLDSSLELLARVKADETGGRLRRIALQCLGALAGIMRGETSPDAREKWLGSAANAIGRMAVGATLPESMATADVLRLLPMAQALEAAKSGAQADFLDVCAERWQAQGDVAEAQPLADVMALAKRGGRFEAKWLALVSAATGRAWRTGGQNLRGFVAAARAWLGGAPPGAYLGGQTIRAVADAVSAASGAHPAVASSMSIVLDIAEVLAEIDPNRALDFVLPVLGAMDASGPASAPLWNRAIAIAREHGLQEHFCDGLVGVSAVPRPMAVRGMAVSLCDRDFWVRDRLTLRLFVGLARDIEWHRYSTGQDFGGVLGVLADFVHRRGTGTFEASCVGLAAAMRGDEARPDGFMAWVMRGLREWAAAHPGAPDRETLSTALVVLSLSAALENPLDLRFIVSAFRSYWRRGGRQSVGYVRSALDSASVDHITGVPGVAVLVAEVWSTPGAEAENCGKDLAGALLDRRLGQEGSLDLFRHVVRDLSGSGCAPDGRARVLERAGTALYAYVHERAEQEWLRQAQSCIRELEQIPTVGPDVRSRIAAIRDDMEARLERVSSQRDPSGRSAVLVEAAPKVENDTVAGMEAKQKADQEVTRRAEEERDAKEAAAKAEAATQAEAKRKADQEKARCAEKKRQAREVPARAEPTAKAEAKQKADKEPARRVEEERQAELVAPKAETERKAAAELAPSPAVALPPEPRRRLPDQSRPTPGPVAPALPCEAGKSPLEPAARVGGAMASLSSEDRQRGRKKMPWGWVAAASLLLVFAGALAWFVIPLSRKLSEATSRQATYGAFMDEGASHLAGGQWDEAALAYEGAKSVPGYEHDHLALKGLYGTHMGRGRAEESAGKSREARDSFHAALCLPGYAEDPAATEALRRVEQRIEWDQQYATAVQLGKEALKAGNHDEAERQFSAALAVPPYAKDSAAREGLRQAREGAFQVAMTQGETALADKRWDAAKAFFQRALVKGGKERDQGVLERIHLAWMAAATEAEARKQWEDVRTACHAAMAVDGYTYDQKAKDAMSRAQQALKRGEGRPVFQTAIRQAQDALGNGRWDDAVTLALDALNVPGYEDDPDAKKIRDTARKGKADAAMYITAMTAAETARQKGQWDRAIEQYRAALAVDGHREDPKARQGLHDAYVGQGDAALRAGRHETRVAVAAYTDATRVAGVNTEEANRKLRQAEQALANWKTYSQHLEGGRIALGRNDWDGAIQAFGAAAAVDGYGDDPDAVKGLAAALIGKGHQHLGQRQWQAAKQALEQARKLPGRDKDTTVRDGIAKADEGIGHDAAYARHMEEARKALMDKDYAAAATGFRKALDVPGYGNDAAAKGELREAEEKKAAASAAPRPDLQDEKRFAQDMKDLKDADVYAARKPGATRDKWLRVRNKAQEIIDQYGARRDVSEARDILSEAKQNLDRLRE